MNTKSNLMMLVIVPFLAICVAQKSAEANDSFGAWGGSWGASSGLFGSQGGPIRNLLAAAPVRRTLARVADRLTSFGSYGGSYGSGGSFGGSRYTGWGSRGSRGYARWNSGSRGSFAGSTGYGGSTGFGGSTASWNSGLAGSSNSYGSWGSSSSYVGTSDYVSSTPSYLAAPSYPAAPSFISAPAVTDSLPYSIGSIGQSFPLDLGIASPAFSSDPLLGSTGIPVETSFDSGTAFPGTAFPTEGFGGNSVVEPYYNGVPTEGFDEGGGSFDGGGSILGPVDGGSGNPFGSPPTEPGSAEPTPGSDDFTGRRNRLRKSTIEVRLPSEADIYVNGKLTKSVGEARSFVSKNQKAGSKYRYEIAAVLNGKRKVKEFTMRAGGTKTIDFDFSTLTTVALQVPDDAKVVLAGNPTNGSGKARKFETKRLTEGEKWKGYTVKVSVVRDGEEIVRERTIDVIGGETYALNFDFDKVDSTAVASNE